LFGVRLAVSAGQHGNTRLVAEHGLVMPASMKALGAEVIAFSNHEPHHVNSMVRYSGLSPRKPGERGGTFGSGFWFDDLKQAYGYPAISVLNGTGTTVGLLMSSAAQESDLTLVFNDENFVSSQSGTSIPIPTFTNESVDGASTVFSVDNDAAAEASLDTQASLGSAPGASGVLYVIPDLSDQSIMDGYKQIVSDNTVDVASSSFGGCDLTYLPAYNGGTDETYILRDENKVLKQGNAQGIAFVASSGDEGALGCVPTSYYPGNPNPENSNFIAGTEGPAEYPNMTGVGGTNLETTITINSQGDITYDAIYDYELALGDPLIPFDYYGVGALLANGIWGSGGGKSAIFAQPAYQHTLFPNSVVRQVPDISMHMGGCPGGIAASCTAGDSFDYVAIDGGLYGLIGTSASSPEFAGVVALLVQKGGGGGPQGAGRVGNINTYIYTKAYNQNLAGGALAPAAKQFFHLFIPGYNGVYTSLDSDYSKVLGVGTPQVANFLKLPQGTAMAGTPQTPSNP
jgi:subtilase family serine protease